MRCPYCGGASRILRKLTYPRYTKFYRVCLPHNEEFVTVEMYEDDLNFNPEKEKKEK